jgi:hypothetical protein
MIEELSLGSSKTTWATWHYQMHANKENGNNQSIMTRYAKNSASMIYIYINFQIREMSTILKLFLALSFIRRYSPEEEQQNMLHRKKHFQSIAS